MQACRCEHGGHTTWNKTLGLTQSTMKPVVCEPLAAVSICTDKQTHLKIISPGFGLLGTSYSGWPDTFSPKKANKGYSVPPAFICNVLAQGRKFTAKSERDVICGKTLLFFHEVITSLRLEWLNETKGLLFDWHSVPLHGTAWPHMQMTGQEGKVWRCQVRAQRGNHQTPAGSWGGHPFTCGSTDSSSQAFSSYRLTCAIL